MGLNNLYFILIFALLLFLLAILQLIKLKTERRIYTRFQLYILFLSSYLYLCAVDWRFLFLVIFDSLLAYICGLLIGKSKAANRSKIAIWGGIGLIAVLAYFKYVNFFVESFSKVFGLKTVTLNIILPLGISFFTFSALSYVIDVYRGICEAETNFIDFGLYISFFPKITAGPIVRWTDFKPQIKNYRGIKLQSFHDGIQIFLFGLFKKMVLADHLGVFVDDVFFAPNVYNTGTVVLSAISYSLQIYLDFSGYSDMAIGLAKILGFDFRANFNLPYIAEDFSDFWNRWHISLSSWFRDYLYIPLGGSRKGVGKTYLNLIVVMLVSGLWHGAGWTFILWGALHGVASCMTRWEKKWELKKNRILKIVRIMGTFLFVTLFWTIFRSESIEKAVIYCRAMFTPHSGISQPYTWTFFALFCVIVATIVAIRKSHVDKESCVNGFYPILDLSKTWQMVIFYTFCGLTILLGYYGNTAFIYGGF